MVVHSTHQQLAQLDELRDEMLQYMKRHFRAVHMETPETLTDLRVNPDLMLEVMRIVMSVL